MMHNNGKNVDLTFYILRLMLHVIKVEFVIIKKE